MQHPFSRPLNERPLIEAFLKVVLNDSRYKDYTFVGKIRSCELELANDDSTSPTRDSEKNRVPGYRSDFDRFNLRKKIVDELFKENMPDDDDEIKLGTGGACPTSPIKKERKAFFLIGPPASGKSAVARKVAEENGAIILDSDFAKRKLPEFDTNAGGATLVHSESSAMIWGMPSWPEDFLPLVRHCTNNDINIVAPRIGNDIKDIIDMAKTFRDVYDYEVHLTLVSLDRKNATVRALNRFEKTGRYIPLSLVFDVYANDPILTYYRLKENHKTLFHSFGKISTDVNLGKPPIVIHCDSTNPAELYQ
ncbi:MAG: zeta toxin family protein [Bacteroidetes bacterium]|nr:zeta toxin family protein [Bacteroidota bacterium]